MHRCNIKTFLEVGKSFAACTCMQNYQIKCIGKKCCSFHGFVFSTLVDKLTLATMNCNRINYSHSCRLRSVVLIVQIF